MTRTNRRTFIQTAAATSLAIGAAPSIHAASKGKKYRTVLIGSGWWGKNILREAMAVGNCQVVALADVDRDVLETAAEEVSSLSSDKPKTYTDVRELFDTEQVDIAIIATPDHWHALNSIAAIKTQVTLGKNAMPAFGDNLNSAEIEAVARYVLTQSQQDWKRSSVGLQ